MTRACVSSSTTCSVSPAFGTSSKPVTSTGVAGPASLTRSPRSSLIARTRPQVVPEKNASPTCSVPFCTSTVATMPRPTSFRASSTTPLARHVRGGLEVEDVGGEQDHVQQVVDALLLQRGDFDRDDVAAPVLDEQAVRRRARG